MSAALIACKLNKAVRLVIRAIWRAARGIAAVGERSRSGADEAIDPAWRHPSRAGEEGAAGMPPATITHPTMPRIPGMLPLRAPACCKFYHR
jgi:hypothetical protein